MRFSKASNQSSNLLDRVSRSSLHSSDLTTNQSQVDQLVGGFVEQATDWKSLAAMMAGGLAYRYTRVGVMGMNVGAMGRSPIRVASMVAGLGLEVTAFELTNRTLLSLSQNPPTPPFDKGGQGRFPNLWSWSGPNGLKQGFLSSFINFGALKSLGHLAQGQNIFLQHGTQDLGMVLGHQLVYKAGLGEKPEGGFAEQLFRAEVTNLQFSASMGLAHSLTGGRILALERGLELSLKNVGAGPSARPQLEGTHGEVSLPTLLGQKFQPVGAMGGNPIHRVTHFIKRENPLRLPFDLMANKKEETVRPGTPAKETATPPLPAESLPSGEKMEPLDSKAEEKFQRLLRELEYKDLKIERHREVVKALRERRDRRTENRLIELLLKDFLSEESMRVHHVDEFLAILKDKDIRNYRRKAKEVFSSGSLERFKGKYTHEFRREAAIALSEKYFWVLEQSASEMQRYAASELGHIRDPRSVEPLLAVLGKHRSNNHAIAIALGNIGDPRAVEPLIRMMEKETNLDAICEIVVALGEIGDPRAVPPLFHLLDDIEKKWSYGLTVYSGIGGLLQKALSKCIPSDLKGLISLLSDSRSHPHIAKLLKERGEAAVEPLIQLLKDPVVEVREGAVRPLREYYTRDFDKQRIVSAILERLEDKTEDKEIHRKLILALGSARDERALEPLIRIFKDKNAAIDLRVAAIDALSEIGDPRAIDPFFEAFEEEEDWWKKDGYFLPMIKIDPKKADNAFASFLRKKYPEYWDVPDFFWKFIDPHLEFYELKATRAWLEKQILREEFRETHEEKLEEKVAEITEAIQEKLSEALGLEMDHEASVSAGNEGFYGSVTMGLGLSLRLEQRLELRLVPLDNITIEVGDSLEEMKERMQTLNFLVHHEVAHVIQEQLKIKNQPIDVDSFRHLDPKEIRYHANEILIDKLGFDAARKIYVHGEGDVLFEEGMRETIAIQAYISLSNIVLRNLKSGNHTLSEENVARFIAVAHEMSQSEEITEKARRGLQSLAKELETWVSSDQGPEKVKEIHLLIGKYRELFRLAALR